MDQPRFRFDGDTFDASRDGQRLSEQLQHVLAYMRQHEWVTLRELELAMREAGVHASNAGVSARLRDLRKRRFGAYTIERQYIANGLWQYRLAEAK